jgi:hypothetical protein
MHLNFDLVKKHPYIFAGGGLVLFVILYMSMSGSSSATASTAAVTTDGVTDQDVQLAQLQASANAQAQQTAGQVQVAQLNAQVTNTQTQAQVDVNDTNTAAALAATLAGVTAGVQTNQSNNDTQVALAQVQGNTSIATTNALAGIINNQTTSAAQTLQTQYNDQTDEYLSDNATNLTAYQSGLDYQNSIANLQAQLTSQQLTNQQTNDQYVLQNAGKPQQSALDATDQTALFASIINPGAAGQVAGASASVANVGTAASTSVINGIVKTGGGILSGLLA